jgi:hypothetical protein
MPLQFWRLLAKLESLMQNQTKCPMHGNEPAEIRKDGK